MTNRLRILCCDLLKMRTIAGMAAAFACLSLGLSARPVQALAATLVVPTDHETIQEAIDAAAGGDTVEVRAGTYAEQLRIDKDLTIVGAGVDATVIRAPATLLPGELPTNAIVEIFNGASVSMSRLTVSGPGSGTCKKGALRHGIRVLQEAHLDFIQGRVENIHDTPMAECLRTGTAILVGGPAGPPASATISQSEIRNFQSAGVIVLGAGSWGDITHNTVTGPGMTAGTQGIELAAGAVGTISHNVVSGNICPAKSKLCGENFFTEFQNGGIVAGGGGPGTVITHNLVFGNQVGLYLSEADLISDNVLVDNDYFAIGLIGVEDGAFTIGKSEISGGGGGVWVIAVFVDMTVVLDRVTFSGLSGPPVEILEDGGFTGTVIGGP